MKQKIETAGIILLIIGLVSVSPSIAMKAGFQDTENQTNPPNTKEDPGMLSGFVYDTSMNPIEGAKIRVSYHDTYQESFSDASGYYHVTDIPLCNCTKNSTCSKQGYDPAWVILSIWENTTYDFVLAPKGHWFYVGGAGSNNYTKIQDAIDNTSNGDTVYVYPGTYKGKIFINTSIRFQGADLLTTFIDGQNNSYDIITCIATDVFISGFTIFNCSEDHSCILFNHTRNCTLYGTRIHTGDHGVTIRNGQNISIINNTFPKSLFIKIGYIAISLIDCVYCTISQNTISSWGGGILLSKAHLQITKNTISETYRGITDMMDTLPGVNTFFIIDENILLNNKAAVFLAGSRNYSITRNEISNSTVGLNLVEEVFSGVNPENVLIKDNLITNSSQAMSIEFSINLTIEGNHLYRNTLGISLLFCSLTSVKRNTFQDNNQTATYQWSFYPFSRISYKIPHFDENFCEKPRGLPYPIIGKWSFIRYSIFFRFPWVTFDQHPASEPYSKGG